VTVVSMPLAELVEDLSIYPRTNLSSVNIAKLVSSLEAGNQLPPIEADQESKRIVDGFHRRRAYLKVLGSDARIGVDLKHYESDGEMFAAAVEANSGHGLGLQEIEKRRAVFRLEAFGVEDGEIARVLRIPPPKIEQIRIRVATVTSETGAPIRLEPLKRPAFWMQGQAMTEAQATAHRSAPGTSYRLPVRQIRDAVRFRLIDENDGRVIADLKSLATELNDYLASLPMGD
jgi:hypothetical protein